MRFLHKQELPCFSEKPLAAAREGKAGKLRGVSRGCMWRGGNQKLQPLAKFSSSSKWVMVPSCHCYGRARWAVSRGKASVCVCTW